MLSQLAARRLSVGPAAPACSVALIAQLNRTLSAAPSIARTQIGLETEKETRTAVDEVASAAQRKERASRSSVVSHSQLAPQDDDRMTSPRPISTLSGREDDEERLRTLSAAEARLQRTAVVLTLLSSNRSDRTSRVHRQLGSTFRDGRRRAGVRHRIKLVRYQLTIHHRRSGSASRFRMRTDRAMHRRRSVWTSCRIDRRLVSSVVISSRRATTRKRSASTRARSMATRANHRTMDC